MQGSPDTEQRRSPRYPAADLLVGVLLSNDYPVRIRDVGRYGFSVETIEPLETGSVESVRLTSADDWTTVLQAQSLYCRPSVTADGMPQFVTGFAFVDGDAADASKTIGTLLQKVTRIHDAR